MVRKFPLGINVGLFVEPGPGFGGRALRKRPQLAREGGDERRQALDAFGPALFVRASQSVGGAFGGVGAAKGGKPRQGPLGLVEGGFGGVPSEGLADGASMGGGEVLGEHGHAGRGAAGGGQIEGVHAGGGFGGGEFARVARVGEGQMERLGVAARGGLHGAGEAALVARERVEPFGEQGFDGADVFGLEGGEEVGVVGLAQDGGHGENRE